jgi:hypothetical protein
VIVAESRSDESQSKSGVWKKAFGVSRCPLLVAKDAVSMNCLLANVSVQTSLAG